MHLGIDIGGTKIELVVLDGAGDERYRTRIATPHGAYSDALAALTRLIAAAETAVGTAGSIGIGVPGTLGLEDGVLRNAFATPYNERPFGRDLAALLGRHVEVGNDANCFALSEAVDGAGRGARVVFGVILGTGVGGGLIVDGRIWTGANAMAGEWGHNPLPLRDEVPDPPVCGCGRRGCIEAYLSGPAMARDHVRLTGKVLSTEAIVAAADAGDAACGRTLARYEQHLAIVLAGVINLLDPDVIVLGGGVSRTGRLYRNVPAQWAAHTYLPPQATRLRPPAHGDASGVRGAAWLGLWAPAAEQGRAKRP
ncbi:MAG: ROK family protein [Burkholderiales bacterium]